MRNWMLLLLGVTACRESGASIAGDVADDAAARAELVQLEQDWAKADESHDTAFYQRTLAEDFLAVYGRDTQDRAAMIKDVSDTSTDWTDIGNEVQQVGFYARGKVAVVTGVASGVMHRGKENEERRGRYTEVFEQRSGRWQAVRGHYSLLGAPDLAVTAAERRRMEDSARTWLTTIYGMWQRGDSAGLMDAYLPPDYPASLMEVAVSALDGRMYPASREGLARSLSDMRATTGREASFDHPTIAVVAPGVVVVTTHSRLAGNERGKKFDARGVSSFVLVERDGRTRAVLEHQSETKN